MTQSQPMMHPTRRRRALLASFAAAGILLGSLFFSTAPASAHGAGFVKSCQPGTDCTKDASKNAVFAVCKPPAAATKCDPGRDVTIRVAGFGGGAVVHLWWLNGEVDDTSASDCTQAVSGGQDVVTERTFLGDVQTGADGKGFLDAHLPPAGGTPGTWSYGSNFLCGTTAGPGQTGIIGDQLFVIYPA